MENRKSEIHMHSTFSDGEFTPGELVEIAKQNNVSILSLTDHDTFEGLEALMKAAGPAGITAFPGIEITAAYHDFYLHLLGYFKSIDSISPELVRRVESMKEQRDDRMRKLIQRIDAALPEPFQGKIHFENVRKAAEGVLGRPHLAREMVRLKIVSTVAEAFDKYLKQHNIEKRNLSIESAIKLIRESGGIPVLAHPGEREYSLCNPAMGKDSAHIPGMLNELKSFGLLGLECVYPFHEKTRKVKFFLELASQLGLIPTGSRDFHGFQRKKILGSTQIDDGFLRRFQEAWG